MVFEKSRGQGGRAATRRVDHLCFDHGAQYFTVRDAEFEKHVAAWFDRGVVQEWNGRVVAIDPDGLRDRTSPHRRFVGVPAMNAIARHLAQDLDVEVARAVSGVRPGPEGWTVLREEDEAGPFDAVLVTLPPAQAVPFLKSAPPLAQLARRVTMRPCWAVMVAFARPAGLEFDGAFVNTGPLSWAARDSSKPGRPAGGCWVLHANPEWSAAHLDDEIVDVERQLLEAFATATGLGQLPPPQHLDAMRWRFAIPDQPLPERSYLDADAGIGIAGDWCGGPRVEGAWLSGDDLARRLLES